jgi:hypothetical protein
MKCQLTDKKTKCPIPMTEDRLLECFHFANQIDVEYHNPRAFRYSLNAFLSALSTVSVMAQKEIESRGNIAEWNAIRESYKNDPWLKAAKKARNVTLHQKAIFDGSKADMGLYRWRRLKLAITNDIPGDIHSAKLLEIWTNSELGRMFLDTEHSAIGEQYGVWRKYWIKEVSNDEDVLTSVRRAIIRAHDLVVDAHKIYGVDLEHLSDDCLKPEELAEVSVLLESDVDPTLRKKWGW